MQQLACHCRRILFALILALPVLAAAQAVDIERAASVEGITEYRLDNGMKVLLMPDRSRSTATINITYFVGSKHESYGETGMAHLLEHMLFYGTPDHEDIKAEISERGGQANGTTSFDRTNYFQTLPAGEENLEWAITMEADRMVNSTISAEDLESEMTVVRNEFEIGETNPIGVLFQRVLAAAYQWHGYGRSTIGARADIENVPVERLQDFYRRYYQPDNAVLILSGNYDTDRALELINREFGQIAAPERTGDMKLWPTYTREPVQDGQRTVTVRRSGEFQALLGSWHVPAASHEDFAAVQVLAHLLGDSPSGRLHKALVDNKLASQVGAFSRALGEPSFLALFAQVDKEQDLDETRREMLAAVEALEESPPTQEEVDRAINALTRNIEQTLNDTNRVGIQLSEWEAAGDWRLMFLNRDRIEAVTVADVIRVANRYLTRDNRTIGQFIPESEPERAVIPAEPDPQVLLADYTGREDREAGEAFDPTPENIEDRVVRFELANGAKVALLPKETRGDRVQGQISMRLGTLESLSGLGGVPAFTGSMLMRGTANRTRQEIRDRVNALQSSLSVSGSNLVNARMETRRDNLDEILDIVADVLQNPSFDDSEIDELRRQQLTQLDQQRDQPIAVASRMLNRHNTPLPPEHPDYVPDFDESEARLRAIEREQLVNFHAAHYGFGPGTTISLVGDFDPQAVRERLEVLFNDFTPEIGFERIARDYRDIEPASMEYQLDDKANAGLIGGHPIRMRDDHPDYPAVSLAGHLLGGGFLSSRLADRIRDTEGLSYGVGGGFNAHSIDERGSFFVYAMYAPENRKRLVEVLFEEFDDAVENGFGEEEVAQGRRGYLQQLELKRSEDAQLMSLLNNYLYLDRDMYHRAEFEQAVSELTAEDVTEAVREHLRPDRLSHVVAGDFEDESEDEPTSDADN
ncbi:MULTISPECIES: pitrilysin family protein [unclassified Wenzhouxiangella]|uniref:M16 family metallopeptidase n=1 Tax=unclassified Wenzhouxiangella TaxID=2613841 RepID=UPI000E328ED2|nr:MULTISPECIES: pitrilysin family protein [unclassified Wenzhouxiangella]RFF28472.1 insulinase family protein [Wenzhouxiangella sp. 15181]RFP69989.1 insulinase family protein [Wenzhouxiangella sp. 15190]